MSQGYFVDEEVVEEFFDTREELPSFLYSSPEERSINLLDRDSVYRVWIKSPGTIQQRRANFMQMMGLDHGKRRKSDCVEEGDLTMADLGRLSSDYGAVLRGSEWKDGSLMSNCSDEVPSSSHDRCSDVQLEPKIKYFDDDESTFVAGGEFGQISVRRFQEGSSNQMTTTGDVDKSFEASSSDQQLLNMPKRRMAGWLRRLGAMTRFAHKKGRNFDSEISDCDQSSSTRKRIPVTSYKKQYKELSALYMGQNFLAHHGAILTMKFSPGGEYLASGGEDGVVRVWKVMECQRSSADDIPVDDPSCIYFGLNQSSELSSLPIDKEKMINSKNLQRTSNSASIVIPQELFRISERPLYEFHGHQSDILDLAWSKDKGLLSCSSDKTARLWKLGCRSCIKVFPHNNYVTCIQFNPIDERYFISGSIDGKARIWEIAACRVVDWTDARQIITAVCYRQDGKGLVIGSIMGDCRFYNLSENHLQLEAEVSFQGRRKKSVDKRITGFQFFPGNTLKLMVTSADSTVRILDGIDVISKYKGLKNSRSRIAAMFTSDGSHIISASEDSNVYMWDHSNQDHIPSSYNTTWSSEHFASSHALIAIPWPGFSSKSLQPDARSSPSTSFPLWSELFSEIATKGAATWPEEKLPLSKQNFSVLGKSQLKLLKASLQMNTPNAWGQVIVTAGSDGKISSFQNFGLPVHR